MGRAKKKIVIRYKKIYIFLFFYKYFHYVSENTAQVVVVNLLYGICQVALHWRVYLLRYDLLITRYFNAALIS